MKACTVSSIEELNSYLTNELAQSVCITHARGIDMSQTAATAAETFAREHPKVRVVCSTEAEAQRVRSRTDNAAIEVMTAKNLSLLVLADERVQVAVGRRNRILDTNEVDVLMEDMKVTGMKAHRLRETTKFFFKSLTDGFADTEGWLIAGEEQRQFSILEENLESRQALLSCELPRKALEGLNAVPDAIETAPAVIVGFERLATLMQKLVLETSDQTFVAMGCTNASPGPDEPYPNVDGLQDLADRDEVQAVKLDMAQPAVPTTTTSCATPFDEFAFVADAVAETLAKAPETETMLIATPNGIWTRYIVKQLEARGIQPSVISPERRVKGDPRSPQANGELKLAALAKLIQDRSDMTALRSWIGLGDWLLRSDAYLELMAWACEHGMPASQAIETLRATPADERNTRVFYKIEQQLNELDQVMEAVGNADIADLEGVLESYGMSVPASVAKAAETKEDLFAAVLAQPVNTYDARVAVASFDQCIGMTADHLFLTGMVNGYLPQLDALDDKHSIDQKLRATIRDRERFDDLMAIGKVSVTVSLFETDAASNAERLPMDVSRIYQQGSTRMVRINPSIFLNR
ncbi:hypothetical protein [Slackia heliotrinireducens]|uniref:hypothetical protein n=1 Tax=Slackia heliotrinireducens TaxID=84110 RepID=UPI00331645D0